jgi:hypothetical protein
MEPRQNEEKKMMMSMDENDVIDDDVDGEHDDDRVSIIC